MLIYMNDYVPHVWVVPAKPEQGTRPLELELEAVVNHHMGARTES